MRQEKDKLYIELKNILARQPGPEVAEQLSVYQGSLKAKTRQMKAMASELNMYQAQVNEYKYEVERLNRELRDLKRKYYSQRRKDQMLKEAAGDASRSLTSIARQTLQQQQQALARSATTKFTGGGFAVK
jgi:predicted RNase H-like nuclease (RuvC/YqgF family)